MGPIDTKRTIVYAVKREDTLALISKRDDVSVKQVKVWNDIKRISGCAPGSASRCTGT